MPRNGSGVMSKPAGTTAVASSTIESAKYNSTVDDIIQDLNDARPIVSGGTGATTAAGARTNLGVDVAQAYIVKTGNYTALLADNNAFHNFTGATPTLSLTAAATLGANWHYDGYASGGPVIIDPNAAELINGAATITVAQYCNFSIKCDGTGFLCVVDPNQTYVDLKLNTLQPLFTIASATTTDLSTVSTIEGTITGTTTITGLGTAAAGTMRNVYFGGALTLTHNATSLILPTGANITTAAGDYAEFRSLGSGNWRCVSYLPKTNMTAIVPITSGTAIATTSGTTADFTGIPSTAKKITVIFNGVSTNGTSIPQVQIGAGSVDTTGYVSGALLTSSANGTLANATTGFICSAAGSATYEYRGHILLTNIGSNTWVGSGTLNTSATGATAQIAILGGSKALSGALDRVRLTTVNGTDTFDAGSVNIFWE